MKHIDLFSGIGGFALAIDRVWTDVEHVFCDNDQFSQAILEKHWPNSKIYGDIRTITADTESKRIRGLAMERQPDEETANSLVDNQTFILTGGFPCQPFSQAGKRRGTEDDRHLWPEMLRVIREFSPLWVIAENVGGLVTWNGGMVLEQVHLDLEGEGYEVQSFIIPACGVNAPHKRDRIWIIAYRTDNGSGRGNSQECRDVGDRELVTPQQERNSPWGESEGRFGWSTSWLEVATRLCRVDDGIPRRLDRTSRLKGLGNAIVPQVAEEICKAIKLCH